MHSKEAPAGAQAVGRALDVLLAFTDDRPAWGLTPLADHLKLSKTTVHRLLSVLEAAELIGRRPGTDRTGWVRRRSRSEGGRCGRRG